MKPREEIFNVNSPNRKSQREEKPPSSVTALLTWFLIGFSLVFGVWRVSVGDCLYAAWIGDFLAVEFVAVLSWMAVVTLIVRVFVDILKLMDSQHTHTHTGTVLEVSSWITSFRLCCIITSSAVINSDVPTEMRRSVLHCSTHTQKHTVIPL